MPTHDAPANLLTTIEDLLMPNGNPHISRCQFFIESGADRRRQTMLSLAVHKSEGDAHGYFASDGDRFRPPHGRAGVLAADGSTVWREHRTLPPIRADGVIPNLADENFVWRGSTVTDRGVIRFRVGKVTAQLIAPTSDEAEALARRVVELLAHD